MRKTIKRQIYKIILKRHRDVTAAIFVYKQRNGGQLVYWIHNNAQEAVMKQKLSFTWFHVNSKTDGIYEPTVIQMHMPQTH